MAEKKKTKSKIKKKVSSGVAHVVSSFNNTIITISDENTGYAKVITESFENTVLSLPKLFPAIKRGQEVDVIFNVPIIISTENE